MSNLYNFLYQYARFYMLAFICQSYKLFFLFKKREVGEGTPAYS